MQSSLIGKIEKARRYAQEKDRVVFSDLSVKFRGENDTYETGYRDGKWHCTCHFFLSWETCSHTMALEQMLEDMLPEAALTTNFGTVGAVEDILNLK